MKKVNVKHCAFMRNAKSDKNIVELFYLNTFYLFFRSQIFFIEY